MYKCLCILNQINFLRLINSKKYGQVYGEVRFCCDNGFVAILKPLKFYTNDYLLKIIIYNCKYELYLCIIRNFEKKMWSNVTLLIIFACENHSPVTKYHSNLQVLFNRFLAIN